MTNNDTLRQITDRILSGGHATVDELLETEPLCTTDELCRHADEIRRKLTGNHLDTCSIINARSGRCSEDCAWCAQSRRFHTGVDEYESVEADRAVAAAKANRAWGVERFSLVTSGRRVTKEQMPHFCDIYRRIAAETDISLCASMGLTGYDEMVMLAEAGVRRYHCNLETSSEYFPRLCRSHTQADKLATIDAARRAGLEICSGGIIGMGETLRDRLLLAKEAYDAGARSIPVNILNPIPGTALQDTPPLAEEEIIRSVALMRFMAPDAVMRFAGGRARLSEHTTERILRGGMNGVMIGDLLTTAGNKADEDYALFRRTGYDI